MQNQGKTANMFELVEQWQRSGKSQQLFSSEHNLKLATFSYWIKKYRQHRISEIGFAKLELKEHSDSGKSARIEIELADGMLIRIF